MPLRFDSCQRAVLPLSDARGDALLSKLDAIVELELAGISSRSSMTSGQAGLSGSK